MTDTNVRALPSSFPKAMPTTGRFQHYIHKPGRLIGNHHVPVKDAERAVRAHALMHRSIERLSAPRYAVWQGPPGSGKSQLIANALLSMGTATAVLIAPPSVFGSRYEGGAVEAFTDLMDEASAYSIVHRQHIAVLLEDVDTSIMAITDHTGHTTATREVTGHLQYLADHRDVHVDFMGWCIPVYVTANAMGELRESLFRDMRASIHTHHADDATKWRIVDTLFKPTNAREVGALKRLLRAYTTEQLTFWPALHHDYKMALIGPAIDASDGNMAPINAALANRPPLNAALLKALAKKRRANRPGTFWTVRKGFWPFDR